MTITNRYTERRNQGQSLTVAQGGAVYVRAGSISLYNTLITDSAAQSGSAIYVNETSDTATVNLVNVTIASNIGLTDNPTTGAAIYSEKGVVNFWNAIVAANKLVNGDDAQDVFKGASAQTTDTIYERASTSSTVNQYGTRPLTLYNGLVGSLDIGNVYAGVLDLKSLCLAELLVSESHYLACARICDRLGKGVALKTVGDAKLFVIFISSDP